MYTMEINAQNPPPGAFQDRPKTIQRSQPTALRTEAQSFIPCETSYAITSNKVSLNPLARIFRPSRAQSWLKLNVHAKAFVPSSRHVHQKSSVEPAKSKSIKQATSTQSAILKAVLPLSSTRLAAESGQLRPKMKLLSDIRLSSEFPIENGLTPACVPATEAEYTGAIESQRQKFKLSQNNDRELSCDWKGTILCANGEEMSRDLDDMSDDACFAEAMAQPPSIHHFNWMGKGVHFRSTTPPVVSLVVIMSLLRPRGLTYGSHTPNLRRAVLFNNALETVDPVYYYGENPDVVSKASGTALQEQVTGDVARVYSKYGYWHDGDIESYDESGEVPELDPLDEQYYDWEDVVLNGWYQNHGVPTWREFVEMDSNASTRNALTRKLGMMERVPFSPIKSKMNEVFTRQDLEALDANDVVISSPLLERGMKNILPDDLFNINNDIFSEKLVNWADEADDMNNWPLMPAVESAVQETLFKDLVRHSVEHTPHTGEYQDSNISTNELDNLLQYECLEMDSNFSVRSDTSTDESGSTDVVTPEVVSPLECETSNAISATMKYDYPLLFHNADLERDEVGDQLKALHSSSADVEFDYLATPRLFYHSDDLQQKQQAAAKQYQDNSTQISYRADVDFFKEFSSIAYPQKCLYESDRNSTNGEASSSTTDPSSSRSQRQHRVTFTDASLRWYYSSPKKEADATLIPEQYSYTATTCAEIDGDKLLPIPTLPVFSSVRAKSREQIEPKSSMEMFDVLEDLATPRYEPVVPKSKQPRSAGLKIKLKKFFRKKVNVLH